MEHTHQAANPTKRERTKGWRYSRSLAILQIPNAVFLYASKDYLSSRPLIAVAATTWLCFSSFAVKVWKEVEEDAVNHTATLLSRYVATLFDIAERTASWTYAAITRWSPGFRARYLQEMINEYGLFNDRGLGLMNACRLDLEKVYVDLLAIDGSDQNSPDLLGSRDHEFTSRSMPQSIWQLLRNQQRGRIPLALVIVGAPGSGKSTLLRHVLMTLATNQQRKYRFKAKFPILIELNRLQKMMKGKSKTQLSLEELCELYFADLKAFPGLEGAIPKGWFGRMFRQGGCVVLLDGLDEVGDDGRRKSVSEWIDAQLRRIGGKGNAFVVTSRPQGYTAAPLQRAQVLLVQPFTDDQMSAFVDRWYFASEYISSGKVSNAAVKRRARKESQDLLDRLRTTSLVQLTSNPLLLTMIAMVHRYSGALPGSRVQLYESACKALLDGWRQARNIADDLTCEQKLAILRPLARHMMETHATSLSLPEAIRVIKPASERVGLHDERVDGFLREIQAGSGLVLEKEDGLWAFAHLSFQEYLTATDWLEVAPTCSCWTGYVQQSWWREAMLQYSAIGDASGIVVACLDEGTPQTFALALDIDRMSRAIQPAVRQRLQKVLHDALHSTDITRFVTAAAAETLRAQQNYIRLSGNNVKWISGSPVTNAEYQLFLLSDKNHTGMRKIPHWHGSWFANGPHDVLLGVLPWQALEFCRWLGSQFPEYWFRLPTVEEASSVACGPKLRVWCDDGEDVTLFGMGDFFEAEEMPFDDARRDPHTTLNALRENCELALALVVDSTYAYDLAFDLMHALALSRGSEFARRFSKREFPHLIRENIIEYAVLHDLRNVSDREAAVTRVRQLKTQFTETGHLTELDSKLPFTCAALYAPDFTEIITMAMERSCNLVAARSVERRIAWLGAFSHAIMLPRAYPQEIDWVISVFTQPLPTPEEARSISRRILDFLPQTDGRCRIALILINELVSVVASQDVDDGTRAWRGYLMSLLHLVRNVERVALRNIDSAPKLWERVSSFTKISRLKRRQPAEYWEELYRFLFVVDARERKMMNAWEGIRIVREVRRDDG